ncbi:MAG: SDR family NAD(P)-dependent oxidoreductase, partial [Rhodanobacter sp.]
MSKALAGKVALVTGGSRGLGAAMAQELANQGADVAISYVASADKAELVAQNLRATGVRALAIRSDQALLTAAKPLIDAVMAHFGRLDVLVNNAAIAVHGRTVDDPELDTEALNRQWQINVLGTVATTRAAAARLSDGGRIIFIGSA